MKSINRAIDRFCYKHPNFGISNLMLYIVIGNAAVYLFTMMDRTNTFIYYLYFNPALILKGQIWRLFTFIFVPYSNEMLWVAISLYFYYSLGNSLERFWGTAKFNLYYLGGIACTILYGVLYTLFSGGVNAYFFNFDATFINLSLFLAFAVINPDVYFLIFFFIPVKAKYLAILYAIPSVLALITSTFPTNLLPIIALASFFIFCGEYMWDSTRIFRASNSKQARDFRRKAKQAEYEEAHREYRHKCAVCGRTDTSNPELEFRYCSRCAGYHCFCMDHINNHVHFTE